MTKNATDFVVETGNWKAAVHSGESIKNITSYDYMESATKAMEVIFRNDKDLGDECEFISLLDESGDDYFKSDYDGELNDIPDVEFGLLTTCYLLKNKNEPKTWKYFLTSKLFENAAQPYNVELALEIEKKYPKHVEDFKRTESMKDVDPDVKKIKIKKPKKK